MEWTQFLRVVVASLFCPYLLAGSPGDAKQSDFIQCSADTRSLISPAKTPFFFGVPSELSHGDFIRTQMQMYLPNEPWVQDAVPLLRKAPGGVYVAVGADRGFNNASLQSETSHILLIDYDPTVVTLNHLNIWLLQVAKNREDYLHLRMRASFDEWKKRFEDHPWGTETEALFRKFIPFEYVGKRKEFKKVVYEASVSGIERGWVRWKKLVSSQTGHRFHSDRCLTSADIPFHGANYIYYDSQFQILQKLAGEGKIKSYLAALGDENALRAIVVSLAQQQLRIGTIDLSNAWWKTYVSEEKLRAALVQLERVAHPNARILLTHGGNHRFRYASLPLNEVLKRPVDETLDTFFRTLTFTLDRESPD